MRKLTFRRFLKAINNYVVFFLTVAFAVSCCMMLFVSTLADDLGLVLTQDNISTAAKLTFGNVMLITFLFAAFDSIRRIFTVDRPVKQITAAAEKIMQGDFSVRIRPVSGMPSDEGFNRIIEAVNKMAEELSGTETLRTDFIANVSHELKTPLAVMGNYATMLQKPQITDEERQEYARAISEAARRLAQLITNILDEFDLGEQLCESLLHFEDIWEKKNLNIETEIQDDVRIRSDSELLSLVWNNLISNAVKFTPEGGTIRVDMNTAGGWVSVSVSDTGIGIRPEVGRRIFEKFYQGDISHATQGNGLGLALVKRVVDILGGEISVQSVCGKGSTFTVKIRRN